MSVLDNIHNPAFYTSGGLGAANPALAQQYTPQPITNTLGETLGGAFGQATSNLVGGLLGANPQGFDQYGDIDVTAPGRSYRASALDEASQQYIQPQLQAATNIYDAGVPELNPLLQGYYDQSAALIDQAAGIDPRTQELALRAVTDSQSPFFAAGTPGSARAAYAAGDAATEAILDRQRQARQDLASAGQDYQKWQTEADFDYLGRYQDALASAPTGPSTGIDYLSGAEVYNTSIGRDLVQKYGPEAFIALQGHDPRLLTGGAGGSYGGQTFGDQGSWYAPIANAAGNAIVGSVAGGVGDWVSSFFNEGGEVKKDDWF